MHTQAFHAHDDPTNDQRDELMIEVDFKWLMAGLGRVVDPQRLRLDPPYAQACLQFALNSDCAPLRNCAIRLKAGLAGLPEPTGHHATHLHYF